MEEETWGTTLQIALVGQMKPVVFSGSNNLAAPTLFSLTDDPFPQFLHEETAQRYRYSPPPNTQGEETPSVADGTYRPRPPRPFASRGRSGKYARQLHERYLQNRERILTEEHNKNMRARQERAEPTVEEKRQADKGRSAAIKKGLARMSAEAKAALRRRMETAAKKRWARMSPEAKAASQRRMDAGRAIQLARYKAERREWEVIRLRLNGASLIEINEKFGFGKGHGRVRTVVRSVDLPEGMRYLCDRGQPFTHGSAIKLSKMLRQSSREFAALISTPNHPQERRVGILYRKLQANLDPAEAQLYIDLRDRVARALLSQGKRGLDGYNRREVLAALFPRYREEYHMLLMTLRGVRGFLAANPDAQESGIAGFVLGQAQAEKRGELPTRCYRELIRWLAERCSDGKKVPKERLPQLMPVILKHRASIAGSEVLSRVAAAVLADTVGVPATIMQQAIGNPLEPMPPNLVRVLLRVHMPELFSPVQAIGPDEPATSEKKKSAASQRTLDKGNFCDRIISELRQIKTLCVDGGRTIVEIQLGSPELAAWKLRDTLPQEDKEVFNSPRQWGPTVGYALRILGNHFGKSPDTVSDWVKASRAGNRQTNGL